MFVLFSNHITCRSCKYEFCWVCNGNWLEHGNHTGGFYKCNKYDPKTVKKGDGTNADGTTADEDEAKAELNRYLHYYQRYHNHDQSKKFAAKQRASTEKRMLDLQQSSTTSALWIDVQYLLTAMLQVTECRNVLKYTYVYAYYLTDGPEKTLFEYLQQQLETSTETLSEMSEQPIEQLEREKLVNYTRVTGTVSLC